MRKIKFRGYSNELRKWVFGNFVHHEIGYFILEDKGFENRVRVKAETIGQYTGLKDENGKEIYEGDIVEWDECMADYQYRTFKMPVEYWNGKFCPISEQLCWEDKLDVKIIGNIYDNKDLLEE
jgi:phage uncharacterized protein TIGR01671